MAATSTASPMVHLSALVVVTVVLAVCSPASAAPLGRRYRVGGPEGWRVPPPEDKEMYYVKWASPITFFVEDSIEFVYKNDSVIKVSKAGYYHCNKTAGLGAGALPRDGSTLFLLDMPGFAYFASADLDHCNKGERLMVNVLAEPPAPSASSPARAPTATPSLSQPTSLAPAPAPAPAMEYESAAVGLFVAPFTHLVVSAAALALAGLV